MIDPGRDTLGDWTLDDGYRSNVVRGRNGNHMARSSVNAMVTGRGFIRAFRGPLLIAGKAGSRALFNTDQNYAGLGAYGEAGNGSVFNARRLLLYIGSGQLYFAGVAIAGVSAASTLSLIKKAAGVYAAGLTTGPIQAGHAQPSAPTLYAKANPGTGHTAMSGAIALGVHRVCSITGQISNVSLPSNVVVLSEQTMILQVPLVDANFQDIWGIDGPKIGFADLGNLYQLPTDVHGEVTEAEIAYTRNVTGASIIIATDVVNITDPDIPDRFTAADQGRRIAFNGFDTYILEINSPTQVKVADTAAAAHAGNAVVTHAIDGITRAVEVSYTNFDLLRQPLAPTKAIPPPAGQFAGSMNDTIWMEADSLIYIFEPGYVGSAPPSSARFASEAAIAYLEAEEGVTLRFSKHTVGALYYVGGVPAIEYQSILKGQGIEFAQNIGIGYQGRVCAWLGKPTTIGTTLEPDFAYGIDIAEFDDPAWKTQTSASPVVFGYDPTGQFECWCKGSMVYARLGPTGKWCAPTDLADGEDGIGGNIVAAVTVFNALYLAVVEGVAIVLYRYDAGTGSLMVVQTDEFRARGSFNTVTMAAVQGRADNTEERVKIEVVGDWTIVDEDALNPLGLVPTDDGVQDFPVREPNVIEAKVHAVRVTMTSHGGDCGVDRIVTAGATSEAII